MDHTRFQIFCVLLVSSLNGKQNILICVNVLILYFFYNCCNGSPRLTKLNLSDMLTYPCIQIWNSKITHHYLVIKLFCFAIPCLPTSYMHPNPINLVICKRKHRAFRKAIQQLVHILMLIMLGTIIFNIISII